MTEVSVDWTGSGPPGVGRGPERYRRLTSLVRLLGGPAVEGPAAAHDGPHQASALGRSAFV